MTNPVISTVEAKEKKLKGNDVYLGSQLAYMEGINKDFFIVSLNIKAYDYIKRTWLLTKYPKLYNKRRGIYLNQEMDLDFFFFGTALELTFKAILVQKGYLIHSIKSIDGKFKKLKQIQKKQPIEINEFFKETTYQYHIKEEKNLIVGLSNESISFGTLCNEEKYKEVLDFEKDIYLFADYIRLMRNQIHLPGDVTDEIISKRISQSQIYIKIIEFVNEHIVKNTNELIKKWNFKYDLISDLKIEI